MTFLESQRVINCKVVLRQINLRAAGALLIFLLGWLSVPAVLLAQDPDVCSMACCVAEGHCCCAATKPFVEGQDRSGIREIGSPELESSCPRLATQPMDSKLLSRTPAPATRHSPPPDDSARIFQRRESYYRPPQLSPDSSRAPPTSFLIA